MMGHPDRRRRTTAPPPSRSSFLLASLTLVVGGRAYRSDAFVVSPSLAPSSVRFGAPGSIGHPTPLLLPTPSIATVPPRTHRPSSFSSSSSLRMSLSTSALTRGVKSLNERLPSPTVVDAVSSLPSLDSIIASDVASTAGITLSEARKELTLLAALSRGDIAVSSDGELIYSFPRDLRGALSSNSAKYKARKVWEEKIFPPLFYGVRVGFGVMLLVSIAAIFSTIAFISASGSSDRDDRDDRRGGGFGGGFGMNLWGPSPFDFFYYRPYYSPYYYNDDPRGRGRYRDPDEMGFLESVFSYVFGDGDPNYDLESRRLKLASKMIRKSEGAVTAEQLAPFCDEAPMPGGGESDYVDEAFVLPIVSSLDGVPTVTEDGDIVYVFPELQQSGAASEYEEEERASRRIDRSDDVLRRAGLPPGSSARQIKGLLDSAGIDTRGAFERSDLVSILDDALSTEGGRPGKRDDERESETGALIEAEGTFTRASSLNKILAGGLGVVNLGGALYLGSILSSPALAGVALPGYMGLVQGFYPLLLGYALLYNVIPAARSYFLSQKNERLRKRNAIRKAWKALVETRKGGSSAVTRKIRAAKNFGLKMKRLKFGSEDVVFDTRTDPEVRKAKDEKTKLKEFDALLAREEGGSGSGGKDWE